MKRALITGVAGMIGSHLLDYLMLQNYEVIGIDNLSYGKLENIASHLDKDRFKFYRIDVGDFDTLKILSRDVDIIVADDGEIRNSQAVEDIFSG